MWHGAAERRLHENGVGVATRQSNDIYEAPYK